MSVYKYGEVELYVNTRTSNEVTDDLKRLVSQATSDQFLVTLGPLRGAYVLNKGDEGIALRFTYKNPLELFEPLPAYINEEQLRISYCVLRVRVEAPLLMGEGWFTETIDARYVISTVATAPSLRVVKVSAPRFSEALSVLVRLLNRDN